MSLIQDSCYTKFVKEKNYISQITSYKEKIDNLKKSSHPDELLSIFFDTLYLCRSKGTYTFSKLARHGFIAESLLHSIEESQCISSSRLKSLRQSIQGVTTELIKDFNDVLIENNSYENEDWKESRYYFEFFLRLATDLDYLKYKHSNCSYC